MVVSTLPELLESLPVEQVCSVLDEILKGNYRGIFKYTVFAFEGSD
jgi:hypothetical protein